MSKYLHSGAVLNGKREYTIERALHSGGFGNTYLAKGIVMDGNIAQDAVYTIKEFFIAKYCTRDTNGCVTVTDNSDAAEFKAAKADFYSEANILHSLKHRGIVPVNEVFEQNNTVYFVMKHLGNTSLEQYVVEQGGVLAEDEALRIIRLMAGAMSYLHNRQILHLDVKPNNVMMCMGVDGKAVPMLIDFGQAMFYDGGGKAQNKHVLGGYTSGYSALELKQPGAAAVFTPSLDVYSLGATLFFMLTGKNPADASTITKRSVYMAMPATVTERTMDTIVAAMSQNPQQRTQSMAAFLAQLKDMSVVDANDSSSANGTQPVTNTIGGEKKKGMSMQFVIGLIVAIIVIGAPTYGLRGCKTASSNKLSDTIDTISNGLSIDGITNPIIVNLVRNMVRVDGGTFMMGATEEQGSDANDDEKPVHQVTLSSYYIGKYEVTQEEWQAVMDSNPSCFKGSGKLPIENVSWNDCQKFIHKLNGITGKNFRMPTEAEWEYAARGGNKSRKYKFAGSNRSDDVAWNMENSGNKTHAVGGKQPNELGLYDMSGNVAEWCNDWYGSYSSQPQINPPGALSGSDRINRGNDWYSGCERLSVRYLSSPTTRYWAIGLRLAI